MIALGADKKAAVEAFWRFSLMVYGRPGVSVALVGLQDRAGHNVNLILFGLWLAIGRGRRLDAAGLAGARAKIVKLDRNVVAPLRDLRRNLKPDPDPDIQNLRKRVLALELVAERRIQAQLAATTAGRAAKGNRIGLAESNLWLILGADFFSPEGELLRETLAGL